MDQKEYLRLINEFLNDQYGDNDYDKLEEKIKEKYEEESIPEYKYKSKINYNLKDLTETKRNSLAEYLINNRNLKIGTFFIKINSFNKNDKHSTRGYSKLINRTEDITISNIELSAYEEVKNKYGSTNIAKVHFSIDKRFNEQPWIKYFGSDDIGKNIPYETLIDIIKWIKINDEMPAFT